jgi:hypothetical protein
MKAAPAIRDNRDFMSTRASQPAQRGLGAKARRRRADDAVATQGGAGDQPVPMDRRRHGRTVTVIHA